MARKRTYGSGSFRPVGEGKYQLRYHGKTQWIDAANDKQADRELGKFVERVEAAECAGPVVLFHHLLDEHIADLRRKKRRDVQTTIQRVDKHVRPELGALDAALMTKRDIKRYIDKRLPHAANATINRELAAIRRAFRIGIGDELISRMPVIENLPEDNARQGFVEEITYRAMLAELPGHVKMPWCFSYYTGMRRGELLKLEWVWVDWTRMVIVIPETVSKNKRRRLVPVYDEMVGFLQYAYQTRDSRCPYIFQRDGKRIKSIRTAIELASARIGEPDLLFHDLRRTGVRNMERAGIPRTVARQVSGHLSESVYIRYAIGAEKDALEVGERMTAFHKQERERGNCGVNCGVSAYMKGGENEPELPVKLKQ